MGAAAVTCHINVNYDPVVGVLSHKLILPPPAPPSITISIEMICMQMWTAGYVTGQNKFTTTVKNGKWDIVLEGHDIGMLIPDVTIPPVNLYYAIMWPFSSRKIAFESSMVKMDGKMVGCSQAWVPLPMMTCGDPVSAPTTLPILNWMNDVTVGLSLTDIVMGAVGIVASVVIDAVFAKLAPPAVKMDWAAELAGKLIPMDRQAIAKKLVSVLVGAGISAADPRKPMKIELKIGMPGISERSISYSDGRLSVGSTLLGGNDNRIGMGAQADAHVVTDPSGTRVYAQGGRSGQPPSTLGTPPPVASGN